MANKKWTEVSQPFQFPPSFTSKSFTLRKMYSRLLHDYEQVYYHRNRGQPIPPPGESSRHSCHLREADIGQKQLRDCMRASLDAHTPPLERHPQCAQSRKP